jgi:hypothetical protein
VDLGEEVEELEEGRAGGISKAFHEEWRDDAKHLAREDLFGLGCFILPASALAFL